METFLTEQEVTEAKALQEILQNVSVSEQVLMNGFLLGFKAGKTLSSKQDTKA